MSVPTGHRIDRTGGVGAEISVPSCDLLILLIILRAGGYVASGLVVVRGGLRGCRVVVGRVRVLGYPRSSRVGRDARQVHSAGAELDEEQDVELA